MNPTTTFSGGRRVPSPHNEPNLTYAPATPERAGLKAKLNEIAAQRVDIPIGIGGKEIRTGRTAQAVVPPRSAR